MPTITKAHTTGTKYKMYPTRIDIPETIREQEVTILNQILATTLDLKTMIKHAHWNVKGKDFYQLHLLFDEMAEEVEEFIDLIAERITALGGLAIGTVRAAAQQSILDEYPLETVDGLSHVRALAERFAVYAKLLRDNIDKTAELPDADTADVLTEVSRDIDKRLWFLEAHIQI